jgi:hypothetical protein
MLGGGVSPFGRRRVSLTRGDEMQLTEEELKAVATAVLLYPAGFTVEAERVAERETCDGLVERGNLEAVEVPDGHGYVLSAEAAAAQGELVERKAEQASLN